MRTRELTQTYLVFLTALLGYCIVLTRDSFIPDRFLADGILIREIALGIATADPSYTNTAAVYSMLGLGDEPLMAYLLGYTLAVAAIAAVWFRCRRLAGGWGMTILLGVTLVLSAVYLGYYSKDVIVLPITIAVLCLPQNKRTLVFTAVLMLAYAYLFRRYWVLVAVLFIAFWFVLPRVKRLGLFFTGAAAVAASSLAVVGALGVAADQFRSDVNEYRTDVGTLIEPFVSLPQPVGGIVNNVLTYVTLIVPLPVATNGGLYYLGIAAVILTLWLLFFRALRDPEVRAVPRIRMSAAAIMAFVTTQSLFEPDYGSALRHLTPLLPLFIYISWVAAGNRAQIQKTAEVAEPAAA